MTHIKRCLTFCLFAALLVNAIGQTFNYAEALQKSMFFYEAQRSGTLPAGNRVNWRGNSALTDGSDVGRNLTGGWYDAGDHVKFGFPMAFSATCLAWGAIDFPQGYTASNQMQYLKSNLRYVNDYFIRCHTAPNELWGQVGSGGTDHAWWGSCEVMQMARPAFKIDATHPGSDLAAETAAAMAAASIVFATDDPTYSATLRSHAIQLYNFADTYRGIYTAAITDASGYYQSYSGYNDELVWGAIWLYRATGDVAYLNKAESYYTNLGTEPQSTIKSYRWGLGWDDKSYGCYVLLAKLTGKDQYKADAERNLDFWTDGVNGQHITYTPGGLAWLDQWGSLRYAANTAFVALYYQSIATTAAKTTKYYNFAVNQINYILGTNPQHRSYVVGFGVNPPINPHHRTNHGAWANNLIGPPTNSRHIIYGALVGGPDSADAYADSRSDFQKNEVACDYNALFSGALSKLTQDLGGAPLANFPVPETPSDEYLVQAHLNGSGPTYTEYSVWVNNHTAWPARIPSQFTFRLFVDISEGLTAGYNLSNYVVSANANNVTFTQLQPWNGSTTIYYTEVTFIPGTMIWPGGQGESTREAQIRIRLPYEAPASAWSPLNDWSYQGITSTLQTTTNIPLYVDGVLVAGQVPNTINIPVTGVTVAPTTTTVSVGSTTTLVATVAPANATNKSVAWSSSNVAIATVNASGVVTGIASGSALITATTQSSGLTATANITVTNIPVTGVTVSPTTATVNAGSTTTLTVTIAPANASNKNVTWSSSNTAVATVSSAGVVTGMAAGSATITATTQSGGFTASSAITVTSVFVPVTGVTVAPTTATVNIGATTTLTANVAPTNATNKLVTWTSSNAAVATVSSAGVVTGVAAGSATITVTTQSGAFIATSVITVSAVSTTPCANPTPITLSFSKDGIGEFCFVTSGTINFVNSWNMQLVEINGVAYTGRWSNSMPARINGNYYIHYVGIVPWAHFEANGMP